MKKIKVLSIIAACVAAFAFTSCNTTDDTVYALTPEQQQNYQAAMAVGSYNDMQLLFEKKNAADVKNQIDSVPTTCRVSMRNDSTINMANFPIAALAEHISLKELSEAIAKEAPRTVSVKYQVTPNSTQDVAYFIACPNVIELNLAYGEPKKAHKVQLVFVPSQQYYGYCTLKDPRQMGFQFTLYQIWIDDKQTDYIKNAATTYSTVNFACRNTNKK